MRLPGTRPWGFEELAAIVDMAIAKSASDEVFLLLADDDGRIETVHIGTLFSEVDSCGVIKKVAIEPYSSGEVNSYAIYFDFVDAEAPEIPGVARIDDICAYCETFDAPGGGEQIDIEPDAENAHDGVATGREAERYARVVWGAHRLLERVVRGDPILVGFRDVHRHQEFCSQRGRRHDPQRCPPLMSLVPPAPPRRRPRRGAQTALPANPAQRLQRVTLSPGADEVKRGWPTLVLDICVRADGFPARTGHFAGRATDRRGEHHGAIAEESGRLLLRIPRWKPPGLVTNLMARRIETGQRLVIWTHGYQRRHGYEITRIETLVDAGDLPGPD